MAESRQIEIGFQHGSGLRLRITEAAYDELRKLLAEVMQRCVSGQDTDPHVLAILSTETFQAIRLALKLKAVGPGAAEPGFTVDFQQRG
jgi:hypothetical protein